MELTDVHEMKFQQKREPVVYAHHTQGICMACAFDVERRNPQYQIMIQFKTE